MKDLKTLLLSVSLASGCGGALGDESSVRIPVLRFLTPSADAESADASYTVKVEFEKILADDTWSLYYVSDATERKGAAIGANLPITARTLVWDTSAMPAGRYYFYGELKSLGTTITSSPAGSVVVAHDGADGNRAPTVALLAPVSSSVVTAGAKTTIRYSGQDADGDSLAYDVELSADDGNTWSVLASDVTTTEWEWSIPAELAGGTSYRLRVTARDPHDATAVAVSTGALSIE